MGLEKKCKKGRIKGLYKISPSNDKGGLHLHYCKYRKHQGVLSPDKARVCINRGCQHYQRYELK